LHALKKKKKMLDNPKLFEAKFERQTSKSADNGNMWPDGTA
jgi:hypothetical protein